MKCDDLADGGAMGRIKFDRDMEGNPAFRTQREGIQEAASGRPPRVCAHCGRSFVPAKEHIFTRFVSVDKKRGRIWLCGYTCDMAWLREHPDKRINNGRRKTRT